MNVSKTLLLFPIILLVVACGGGSDGGGMTTPTVCIDFTGGTAATSGSVVAQQGSGSTCDVVAVDLIVTGVNDLFGMGVTLSYDPAVASYEGLTTVGSVLAQGGVQVQALELESSGQVLIGATRTGATTNGVNVAGSQLLLRVLFRKVGSGGMTTISYSDNQLLDAQQPPMSIPGISWSAGQLVVQ